jgi:putative transposase
VTKALDVSMGRFYKWKKSPVSEREAKKIALQNTIRQEYERHQGFAGSYSIAGHLHDIKQYAKMSRTRVAREMKKLGLKCRTQKNFITTTDSNHNEPIAENLLNRQFNPEQMNTAWVSDLNYLRVANGWQSPKQKELYYSFSKLVHLLQL